jgi:2-polyprenyl-3-methyl-5-hydroxy-6-metoxy-1,4-benzoquinol methylase
MDPRYAAIYPDLYRNHWWWRVRERMLVETIRGLTPQPPIKILDVGCGAGLFFDALQQFGDVTGIESDRGSVNGDNRWAHRIVCGELDESYSPPAPFDLILALDVLEHVPDATTLLRHAARVLNQRGRILVTVPAFQWLWTSHDDLNHHVKRYTAAQLRSTLEASGLVVHDVRYLFQSLIVPKLAVKLSETVAARRAKLPHIPGRLVSSALQTWFWTEFKLLPPLPFGTSVLAVAALPPAAN